MGIHVTIQNQMIASYLAWQLAMSWCEDDISLHMIQIQFQCFPIHVFDM